MGDLEIVAYRPKPGYEEELLKLVRRHVPELRALNLVTDRPAQAMRDGTVVETFEWREGAVEQAHEHPAVLTLWEEFALCADYVPLRERPEAGDLFGQFQPVHYD